MKLNSNVKILRFLGGMVMYFRNEQLIMNKSIEKIYDLIKKIIVDNGESYYSHEDLQEYILLQEKSIQAIRYVRSQLDSDNLDVRKYATQILGEHHDQLEKINMCIQRLYDLLLLEKSNFIK